MRALTDREKRTVRLAVAGIAIYLVLFFGLRVGKALSRERHDYLERVEEARLLKQRLAVYTDKAEALRKLMEDLRTDPARLSKATVVAEASAAIQQAATSAGLQLGPVREAPARASAKELAQIQLEGTGPVPAVLALLHTLGSVGFPLVVDAVQFNSDNARPGALKMTLTILILDFDQWKTAEASHA